MKSLHYLPKCGINPQISFKFFVQYFVKVFSLDFLIVGSNIWVVFTELPEFFGYALKSSELFITINLIII